MQHETLHAKVIYDSFSSRSLVARWQPMIVSCLLAIGLAACGDTDFGDGTDASAVADVLPAQALDTNALSPIKSASAATPSSSSASISSGQNASAPASTLLPDPAAPLSWHEVAIRDMRAPDGSFALNDDKLLHRTLVSPSSQYERAVLVMGRYGTSTAFTDANPNYRTQLSWVSADNPSRTLARWTRIILWDQIYLSERFGSNHAAGYTGNSRVRTWGYEMWIKNKAGVWSRVFQTDKKGAEAWRPTFKGDASFDTSAHDLRAESDGSYSARPMPALGFDSSGSYWISHGYAGGRRDVNPDDVADILVLCYSRLVLDNPNGVDDRKHARFLFSVGADWLPPADRRDVTMYPSVGASRHKYVEIEPTLHVMHTMTEAEFKANPPPR